MAGTITIDSGNSERDGWDTVPRYRQDTADDAAPNNFTGVQVANDSDRLYLRFLMSESQNLNFRHNFYLDVDQKRTTGYYGTGSGHLPIGAEYLIQGTSLFRFTANAQNGWEWEWVEGLDFSSTPTTDMELSVSRDAFGDPTAFDFTLYAGNFDLGRKEDYYPSNSNLPGGGFFTYLMGEIVSIDDITLAIKAGSTDGKYDVNGDSAVNDADRDYWVTSIQQTNYGDANLDGAVDTEDLITVFQAGEYEDAIVGNSRWATGDWTGDCEFDSGDLILALSSGALSPVGQAQGAVSAVPEPSSVVLGVTGLLASLALRRQRGSR